MTSLRQRMTENMQVRKLALNTLTCYPQQVSLFARHFNKSPEQLGPEDMWSLLLDSIAEWLEDLTCAPFHRCNSRAEYTFQVPDVTGRVHGRTSLEGISLRAYLSE